ncbi:MAG: hypothetical protein A3D89_01785 [Planctomycetes bacterium RIFCSPHIGHO2_02_FULL_52_58]|nr:MAG: hypothetical protein A3D89_01785 [Planctomycetes bacterium RIFCSPHIGHO2_02_FULL_52_58]
MIDDVAKDLEIFLKQKATQINMKIEALEIMPDQIKCMRASREIRLRQTRHKGLKPCPYNLAGASWKPAMFGVGPTPTEPLFSGLRGSFFLEVIVNNLPVQDGHYYRDVPDFFPQASGWVMR